MDGLKKLVDASVEVSKPNYDGQNGAKVHLTAYKTKGRNSYVHKYYRIDSHFQFLPLTSEAYWVGQLSYFLFVSSCLHRCTSSAEA